MTPRSTSFACALFLLLLLPAQVAAVCGDGTVDVDEACDDGDVAPGDGCSATCAVEPCFDCAGHPSTCAPVPDGLRCDDGVFCNGEDRCANGACVFHAGDPCARNGSCANLCQEASPPEQPEGTCWRPAGTPCPSDGLSCTVDRCNAVGECSHVPDHAVCEATNTCGRSQCDVRVGCGQLGAPRFDCVTGGKGKLVLRAPPGGRNRIVWGYRQGEAFAQHDLGTPESDTSYGLCVFDTRSGGSVLATALHIPPGRGWRSRAPSGYLFKDASGREDGVRRIRLRPGTTGHSSMSFLAEGSAVPMPDAVGGETLLDAANGVTVQLVNDDGVCWSTTFIGARENTRAEFKANRSPAAVPSAVGDYAVGRTTMTVTDALDSRRTFLTDVWYPVAPEDAAGRPRSRIDVLFASIDSPRAVDGAPAAPAGQHGFPVILFSHGSCGLRYQSWTLMEILASHGFVVASADHPGSNAIACFLGGNSVPTDAIRDWELVLEALQARNGDPDDPLVGRLRTDIVGVTGHSLGAQVAVDFTTGHDVVKAVMPVLYPSAWPNAPSPSAIPTFLVTATRDRFRGAGYQAFAAAAGRPSFLLDVDNGVHESFANLCDIRDVLLAVPGVPNTIRDLLEDLGGDACGVDVRNPTDVMDVVGRYGAAFFLEALLGKSEYDAFLDEAPVAASIPAELHWDGALPCGGPCDPASTDTPCSTNAECASDEYCAFAFGGCADEGSCRRRPTACDEPSEPVCGCDGQTHASPCAAAVAGVRVESSGACQLTCTSSAACAPTEYCSRPIGGCADEGVCVARPGTCGPADAPVCGCDDQAYPSACAAAASGSSVLNHGPCLIPSVCTSNAECPADQYCGAAVGKCGGAGACESRPTSCPFIYDPVCGCDGQEHVNACYAQQAGVRVQATGPCVGS